ncbi:pancreatic lipase-related protein 2 [Amyelois transitella]|uniref:pancreatic lipase-related protein 2 n=1 Tax=Amyelois transitella TaxID=680683 RepID=UPI0029904FEB|nr:pancreatic lipase-related protein 2 [Amyelois transitella]
MHFLYVISCALIIKSVDSFLSNKTIEGYPVSFLTDGCPGSMKPSEISKENLKFVEIYVYGLKGEGRNKYNYNTVHKMAEDPTIDWSKRTLLYVPGWMDSLRSAPMSRILKFFYRRMGYNVWILDILKFMTQEYPIAVRAMMAVGDRVGEMLANLTSLQPQFDPKKLELIGNSLGGHTMSFIAKSYYRLTGVKVSRLTGLDAAGPCFRNRGPDGRIDESDADFVDLILTNIDTFGMAPPVGHVNFYVNGGEYQPGDGYWMMCGPFCSHSRSFTVWGAALLFPNSFIAMKCDSVQDARDRKCYDRMPVETNVLGPNVDRNKTGIYFLPTTNVFPYFMGKNGLKKENDYVLRKLTELNAVDVLKM